jgi:hypothetical protein
MAIAAIVALAARLGLAHGLGGMLALLSGIGTGQQLPDPLANRLCGRMPASN